MSKPAAKKKQQLIYHGTLKGLKKEIESEEQLGSAERFKAVKQRQFMPRNLATAVMLRIAKEENWSDHQWNEKVAHVSPEQFVMTALILNHEEEEEKKEVRKRSKTKRRKLLKEIEGAHAFLEKTGATDARVEKALEIVRALLREFYFLPNTLDLYAAAGRGKRRYHFDDALLSYLDGRGLTPKEIDTVFKKCERRRPTYEQIVQRLHVLRRNRKKEAR